MKANRLTDIVIRQLKAADKLRVVVFQWMDF